MKKTNKAMNILVMERKIDLDMALPEVAYLIQITQDSEEQEVSQKVGLEDKFNIMKFKEVEDMLKRIEEEEL